MADTIGQVKWIIEVDTSKGEAQLRAFDGKVKDTASNTEKGSDRMSKAFSVIGKVGITAAIAAVTAFGVAVTKNIGAAVRRFDTLNNAPRVLENLGFSAKASEKAIDTLDKGIRGLPTSLDQAASALTSIAAASGLGVEEATRLTLAFNNMALAGGKGPAEAQRALVQYTQALGRGKFFMQDFNTLAEVMPAQLNQVAKALLGPKANVRQLGTALSTGKLDISDFNNEIIKLNEKGGKNIVAFSKQAKDSTSGIETGFANMNTAITRGITKVFKVIGKENITKTLSGIGKVMEDTLGAIADGLKIFSDVAGEVMKFLKPLFDFISKNQVIVDVLKNTLIVLAAILGGALILAVVAVTTVVAALVLAFNILVQAFQVVGQQAAIIWGGIVTVWNAAVPFFKVIWTGIQTAFAAVSSFFITRFTQALNGIKKAWSVAAGFFRSVWNGIKSAFSGVSGWFSSVFRAAYSGVTSIWSKIGSFFSGIWGKIKSAFGKVRDLGKNIVEGLWNGISDMAGWIGNKIKGFGDGVLKKLKDFFGIKSPSRVMRDEVGKMLGEGIAVGIEQSTKTAVTAAQTASKKVTDAFSKASGTIAMDTSFNSSLGVSDSASQMASRDLNGTSDNGNVINHIGTITIGNEVDADKWLTKLTRESELTSKGLSRAEQR
jgi:tape measure domain-containing protein